MRTRFGPFLVALAIVIADRLSKIAISGSLQSFETIPLIPGWLRIVHAENTGAAFGILSDGNLWLRRIVLIGISALVMVFVASAIWKAKYGLESLLSRLALAFVLGGATGNLYDRVVRGAVTDFIEVYHGDWSFPAFNVADSAITVGAILLLLEMIRAPKERSSPRLAEE